MASGYGLAGGTFSSQSFLSPFFLPTRLSIPCRALHPFLYFLNCAQLPPLKLTSPAKYKPNITNDINRSLPLLPLLARSARLLRREHERGRREWREEMPAGDGGLLRVFTP